MERKFILPEKDRQAMADRLHQFLFDALPGKKLEVIVSQYKPPRSSAQNRALFGCAYKALAEQMGLSGAREIDELHTVFCGDFWGWQEYSVLGQRKKRPKRTTTKNEAGEREVISKLLFSEFYDFVTRKSAEFGYFIPPIDPEYFLKEETTTPKE